MAAPWRMEFHAPADRRCSRHHQRSGPDQQPCARLLAAGSRATHHVSDRDRHGRTAAPGEHTVAIALRPQPGHGHLQGRHRYLFRQTVGQRTDSAGQGSIARRHRDRDGTGVHRIRRNLYVHGRSQARGPQDQRGALHCQRLADDSGLDHQAAVEDRSRRQRGQHRRRIRKAVSCTARSRATDGLQAQLPRRHDGACGKQCECRRRLHRAQRRAVSRPHAGTGREHRRNQGDRDRFAKRRPGAGVRRRRRQGRSGSADRRGNVERERSRTGHRDAVDRREQPHRRAARRRQTQGDRPLAAGRRDRAYRLRPDASRRGNDRDRRRRISSKARCWWSLCCS